MNEGTQTETRKRQVKKAEYLVEVRRNTNPVSNETVGWLTVSTLDGPAHDDTASAMKWVRTYGTPGGEYRIVAVKWQGKVEVEKKEVRRLA